LSVRGSFANTLSLKQRLGESKQFTHLNCPDIPTIKDETDPSGVRFYVLPDGSRFPSVTTVLGDTKKEAITEWREEVGHEQAAKISGRASIRGNKIHKICEHYLNNDMDGYLAPFLPDDLLSFKKMKALLDTHVDNIYAQEVGLFSKFLKTAGRVDLVAEWDGKLSIIDFKTSAKMKRKEWIDHYFMQASAYCVMFEELTGIPISRTVILMSVDNYEPLVFLEKRDNYIFQFIEAREAFERKYNV